MNINEKELTKKVAESLKRRGFPIVKDDVKVGKNRPDLVAFKVDNNGNLVAEVVVEVRINPDPSAQQQLLKYVKDLNVSYALLTTADKDYWFDGNTFLPIDEPELPKDSNYLVKEEDIYELISKAMDRLRDSFRYEQLIMILSSVLLVRTYLNEKEKMDIWWTIENKEDLFHLINEANDYYSIDFNSLLQFELTEEHIQFLVSKLSALPVKDPVLQKVLLKRWENRTTGQYLSPEHVRSLFANLTKQLTFDKSKVVDLATGLGSITFEVMKANNIKQIIGFEVQKETCNFFKVLSILGGYDSVTAICADTLKSNYKLQSDSYSLALVDPPLGGRYRFSEEQAANFLVAKSQGAGDIADLFIERAIQVVEPGGYIIALVPEKVLFSGPSQITRDFIKDKTIIEAIISLPTHTLKPYSMVKTSLLILRKKQNKTEIAKELFLARAEIIDEFEEIVGKFSSWKRGENARG